jgi:hypothetical protein
MNLQYDLTSFVRGIKRFKNQSPVTSHQSPVNSRQETWELAKSFKLKKHPLDTTFCIFDY